MSPETETRELPAFAPLPKTDEEKREIWRANMRKAQERAAEGHRRRREARAAMPRGPLTSEQALDIFRSEIATAEIMIELARVFKKQVREGSQLSKYRASIDILDRIVGRPNQAKSDDEISPPTIIIESEIFDQIAKAADAEE